MLGAMGLSTGSPVSHTRRAEELTYFPDTLQQEVQAAAAATDFGSENTGNDCPEATHWKEVRAEPFPQTVCL